MGGKLKPYREYVSTSTVPGYLMKDTHVHIYSLLRGTKRMKIMLAVSAKPEESAIFIFFTQLKNGALPTVYIESRHLG